MNLYDELIKRQTIPGAFENWADYRENLSNTIIEETGDYKTLAIIGVGECNDFNLKKLIGHYECITLIDRNKIDVNKISEKFNLTKEENLKLQTRELDIIGIDDSEYRELCDELVAEIINRPDTKITKLAEKYTAKIEELTNINRIIKSQKPEYDCVLISGVHSQLYNMFARIWDALTVTLSESVRLNGQIYHNTNGDNEDIMEAGRIVYGKISKANTDNMSHINEVIKAMANKGCIFINELRRCGTSGGVEGAYQCLKDLKRCADEKSIEILNVEMLMWPFDVKNGKLYEMEMIHFK